GGNQAGQRRRTLRNPIGYAARLRNRIAQLRGPREVQRKGRGGRPHGEQSRTDPCLPAMGERGRRDRSGVVQAPAGRRLLPPAGAPGYSVLLRRFVLLTQREPEDEG